jgi:hypothetical protein
MDHEVGVAKEFIVDLLLLATKGVEADQLLLGL